MYKIKTLSLLFAPPLLENSSITKLIIIYLAFKLYINIFILLSNIWLSVTNYLWVIFYISNIYLLLIIFTLSITLFDIVKSLQNNQHFNKFFRGLDKGNFLLSKILQLFYEKSNWRAI